MDSFFFKIFYVVYLLYPALHVYLIYVSEVESESLVSNKIPNINGTSFVVRGSVVVGGFGHLSIRFFTQFDRTNACSCRASKTVTKSSFLFQVWSTSTQVVVASSPVP